MKRWKAVATIAALFAAVFTVMAVAGGAAAHVLPTMDPTVDPQTVNIPYVAWAGEEIQFQKCYDLSDLDGLGFTRGMTVPLVAHFNVVDPTIDLASSVTPTWEGGGTAGIGNLVWADDGRLCASGTFYSPSAGLADILLNVTGLDGRTTVLPKHDFLGIWMRMSAPTIAELPGGGDNGTGSFNLGSNGGDYVAPGIVGVTVTGTFPFAGHTWTFPGTNDWPNLAKMLATDSSPFVTSPGDAWYRWDIHDNNAKDEGHPKLTPPCTSVASALPAGVLDGVDNCLQYHPDRYSRVAGYDDATLAAIFDPNGIGVGPFDPLVQPTVLGNGVVDAYDVPMPAAQINLVLAGAAGMAGPTGALEQADKSVLFSRDGKGTTTGDAAAHNLYAPYYSQYIPATARPGLSSGVAGPFNINDVSGFLTGPTGLYDNWSILAGIPGKGSSPAGTPPYQSGFEKCKYADGEWVAGAATGNAGFDTHQYLTGTVYTDEHGFAEALYDPNAGFTLAEDANSRCGSFLIGPSTFKSTIQATAVYPYKKVGAAQKSNVLTKTVITASLKSLTCVPKGPFEAFCVETIKDPWGAPMSGVKVSFTANSTANANIQPDSAKVGALDTTDQHVIGQDRQQQIVQVMTGPHGMAGVVITDSYATDCVNVRAENALTRVNGSGVSVFLDFNPASGTACNVSPPVIQPPAVGPATPPASKPTDNESQTVVSNSGQTAVVSTTGSTGAVTALTDTPSVVSVATPKIVTTIAAARFVTVSHVRYVAVNLKSTAKTAKVKITMLGKNGKTIGTSVKLVKTNQLVKVMKVGAKVMSVRVAVVG